MSMRLVFENFGWKNLEELAGPDLRCWTKGDVKIFIFLFYKINVHCTLYTKQLE